FYEYHNNYMAFRNTTAQARHWPLMYWRRDNEAMGTAPAPFHYFFEVAKENNTLVAARPNFVRQADDSNAENPNPNWGIMAWETFLFPMPDNEHQVRLRALEWYRQNEQQGRNIVFRETINHVIDDDRHGTQRSTYPQGRLGSNRSKVRYGQREYMLSRCTRYGNVCLDCAYVLEAAGLFERNYTMTKPRTVVRGNRNAAAHPSNWWVTMLNRVGQEGAQLQPEWLHTDVRNFTPAQKAAFYTNFDRVMEMVSAELARQHNGIPINRSKFLKAPVINVQGCVANRNQKQILRERTAAAIQTLKGMIGQLHNNQPIDMTQQDFSNPVLKDMIMEIERKYMHKEVLRHDVRDHTLKFDSNMKRIELRNVRRRKNEVVYENCLEVRTWRPRLATQIANVDAQPNPIDYHRVCYYANRMGQYGDQVEAGGSAYITAADEVVHREPKTQWRGDGFVTRWAQGSHAWITRENMPARAGLPYTEGGVAMGTK
ncbi:MAG: hypothetical protein ACO32I_08580, partial [Candidatus Limnocylindrus sp.]